MVSNPVTFKIRSMYYSLPKTISILAGIGVLIIDFITGKDIEFPIVYTIPVGLAAWRKKSGTFMILSIILPLVRVFFYLLWSERSLFTLALFNLPVTITVLLLYGFLIRKTSVQTEKLENKLKILEGILPICASCKRIRNMKGEFEQIENYITQRSEAQFTHTVCPDCAQKLYPDLYQQHTVSVK